MIDELHIQNLALIDAITLVPSPRFTVITGETGAGKTAIVSALRLLLGERASQEIIHADSDYLEVAARFMPRSSADTQRRIDKEKAAQLQNIFPDSFLRRFEKDAGKALLSIYDTDGEAIIKRRVIKEGRSRATINGSMVSLKELSAILDPHIDLCGQFDHQYIFESGYQQIVLDSWGSQYINEPKAAYVQAFKRAKDAQDAYKELLELHETSLDRVDEARYILQEINEVDPQEGEYEELQHALNRSEHGEALMRASSSAYEALGGEDGSLDCLNKALSELENVQQLDTDYESMIQRLREACYVLEDVSRELYDHAESLEFDPNELEEMQTRMASFQWLFKRYGPTLGDVLRKRDEAERLIAACDNYDSEIKKAKQECDEAEAYVQKCAVDLDEARKKAIPGLTSKINEVMKMLHMDGAELSIAITERKRSEWTTQSPSRICFEYAAVSGAIPRPLERIASGGEISRVMLALKTVLGEHDNVDTLVFDEIDSGTGGTVAHSVGLLLAQLSKTHQIIAITHHAQLAACADVHYVVTRKGDSTVLTKVEDDKRTEEIARMLSGSITGSSLSHAKELLDDAKRGELSQKTKPTWFSGRLIEKRCILVQSVPGHVLLFCALGEVFEMSRDVNLLRTDICA